MDSQVIDDTSPSSVVHDEFASPDDLFEESLLSDDVLSKEIDDLIDPPPSQHHSQSQSQVESSEFVSILNKDLPDRKPRLSRSKTLKLPTRVQPQRSSTSGVSLSPSSPLPPPKKPKKVSKGASKPGGAAKGKTPIDAPSLPTVPVPDSSPTCPDWRQTFSRV